FPDQQPNRIAVGDTFWQIRQIDPYRAKIRNNPYFCGPVSCGSKHFVAENETSSVVHVIFRY
ncbi:MAG: hypothetical protein WC110_04230, partial [Bacteroidales bacterium]